MSLSSFGQVKIQLNKKSQICLKDGVGLKGRSLLILYFEFEFRKHRTIKRDANG
jgi:hypothetical protein